MAKPKHSKGKFTTSGVTELNAYLCLSHRPFEYRNRQVRFAGFAYSTNCIDLIGKLSAHSFTGKIEHAVPVTLYGFDAVASSPEEVFSRAEESYASAWEVLRKILDGAKWLVKNGEWIEVSEENYNKVWNATPPDLRCVESDGLGRMGLRVGPDIEISMPAPGQSVAIGESIYWLSNSNIYQAGVDLASGPDITNWHWSGINGSHVAHDVGVKPPRATPPSGPEIPLLQFGGSRKIIIPGSKDA